MYVPLHVKSDYSLGYGTASVEELVHAASTLGYRSLALTDLENLYGQVRFHHACRRRGIRPLTGIELRPGFDGRREVGRRKGRVILLAADRKGYGNLCRIVSLRRGAAEAREEGGLGADPLPLVARHSEGLFALSDDPSVVERLLAQGSFSRKRLGLLLVRPAPFETDEMQRKAAARLGVHLVADLDAVFPREEDHSLHVLQLAIRQGRLMGEVVSGKEMENKDRRLRAPAEVESLFSDLPEAIAATAEIADACRLELENLEEVQSPGRHGDERDAEKLRQLCDAALSGRPAGALWTESHARRLDEELKIFAELGFSGFMLVVAEILAYCRKEGIPVVVRGSAVSSLALYLLGGSPVDPLSAGLLFERFLHPGKSAWPDVDIDLPWHRREEVIDWTYRHFGRERTVMVAAHHTFRRRSALREGMKAWGARPALIESLGRALPPEDLAEPSFDFSSLAGKISRADPALKESAVFDTSSPSFILPLVQRLVGRPHHIAAHPGGIVVGRGSLEDFLPRERAPKGVVITQFDLLSVARLGLIKIDLLGNRCLSELEETLELAGYPLPLRLDSLPPEDAKALDLIDRAETVGCFQLESPAMRSLLGRIPIRGLSDLVAALALIRPGAAAGTVKSAFIRRARGEEIESMLFPVLSDRLAETHGLLLYEEDIMLLLSRTGGLSLGEADELRATLVESGGDPTILSELEAGFLARAASRGEKDAELAERSWSAAARFAAYSFNKAHAESYGRLAYLSAYTKARHPVEFACALLNHHQGLYPLRTLAGEFIRMGVELRNPQVNSSGYRSRVEGGAVRVGLDKVKGLTLRTARALLKERDARGAFTELGQLLGRVRINRREITALVLCGACDGLIPLSAGNYPFAHEAVLDWISEGRDPAGLIDLKIPRPVDGDTERVRLYKALVRVRSELRILEMHLHSHPVSLLRQQAQRYGCVPVRKATEAAAGTRLRLAVTIAAMRRTGTGKGPMQFLTLEDETGLLEAVVHPDSYRRMGERIATPGPFLVEGTLVRRQGIRHLEVRSIDPFHRRGELFA